MARRNTILVLTGAFALLGASLFLAQAPSPVSAQSHPPAIASSKSGAGKASITAALPAHQSLAGLTRIEILPNNITILGPRYSQRVVVEGSFTDGHQEELTSLATLAVSNPKIAIVGKDNLTLPQSDGQTTISAAVGGHRATATINVKDFEQATTWSFRNDVLPVMTKMGCNSGPCHGAAAGKNGFKLTLRGYDPEVDYYTLTHQALAPTALRLIPRGRSMGGATSSVVE